MNPMKALSSLTTHEPDDSIVVSGCLQTDGSTVSSMADWCVYLTARIIELKFSHPSSFLPPPSPAVLKPTCHHAVHWQLMFIAFWRGGDDQLVFMVYCCLFSSFNYTSRVIPSTSCFCRQTRHHAGHQQSMVTAFSAGGRQYVSFIFDCCLFLALKKHLTSPPLLLLPPAYSSP
jgi:hypothetical protein